MLLDTFSTWLRDLLEPAPIKDYGPNGLQVDAGGEVHHVVVGVTSNLELIDAAVARGSDTLVVHHGLYWGAGPHPAVGPLGRRVRALMTGGVSLFGYHLPLDGHPTLGNAVQLAAVLGATSTEPAFVHRGIPAGTIATFEDGVTPSELESRLCREVSDRTLFFAHGPTNIRRVGIVTGGAPRDAEQAATLGLDGFITGEAGEYSLATARESSIHFAACGHHRSERFGPMALARHIGSSFPNLKVEFVDVDNPA